MRENKILGIEVEKTTIQDVLEKIKKVTLKGNGFFHIVSLNPEIFVISHKDPLFMEVIRRANLKIVDGVGVVMAGRLLGVEVGERLAGADLFKDLMAMAVEKSLRVVIIGGETKLAERVANCYNRKSAGKGFIGLEGFKNIKKPRDEERRRIFSIVARHKPHFVFVAFGSPFQEIWLWENRKRFHSAVCLGVGGGLDFLAGKIDRAPRWMRRWGGEWFYRLLRQPWRWRRQRRLIKFIWLVIKQKIGYDQAN